MWENIVDLWKSSVLVKVVSLSIVVAVVAAVVSMVNHGPPPAQPATPVSAAQQMLQKVSPVPVQIPPAILNAIPTPPPQVVQQAQGTGQVLMNTAGKGAQVAQTAVDVAGTMVNAGKNAADRFFGNQQQAQPSPAPQNPPPQQQPPVIPPP